MQIGDGFVVVVVVAVVVVAMAVVEVVVVVGAYERVFRRGFSLQEEEK